MNSVHFVCIIHLSNQLISNAIYQLLAGNGHEIILSENPMTARVTPEIILVDAKTLDHNLAIRFPKAKLLLVDTGIDRSEIVRILMAHKIHGILSPDMGLNLLRKALKVVSEGQVWIDNGLFKAVLDHWRALSSTDPHGRITHREQEIIDFVAKGLSNKEIAQRLAISEHTVSRHLYNIFRMLNIQNRTKLMILGRVASKHKHYPLKA